MAMDEGTMNLLVQYLSAAGQDIGSGKTLGTNVNAVTQQQVSARSYANLLNKLLSNGGKVSMDKDNVSIKAPANAFGGMSNPVSGEQMGAQNIQKTMTEPYTGEQLSGRLSAPTGGGQQGGGLTSEYVKNLLLGGGSSGNPPSSPLGNISGADLAGLTPQDISQALRFKLTQDEVMRNNISQTIDDVYKMQRIQAAAQPESMFPVPVPGIGPVTHDQWKALPNDAKSYAAYVYQSKQLNPDEPVMSYEEFKGTDETTKSKFLRELMADPELMKAEMGLRRSGASVVNVNNKIDEKKALAGIEGQLYFKSGKDQQDIRRYVGSREFRLDMIDAPPEFDNDEDKAKMYIIAKRYTSMLESTAKSVKPIEIDWKTKTGKWEVVWNDDTEEVIKRALY